MVGDDVPAIDHVHVPAGAVGQGQARNADVLAVGQVDEPSPDPAGDGVFALAGFDQVLHGGQLVFHSLLFRLDGGPGQGVAAAPDGTLAPDADIAAVGPGGVVQRAEVEQAGVALHLGALKPAADAGRIGFRLLCALQHSAFGQIQLHIAVPKQRPAPVDPRREIDAVTCPAGVQGPLQGGGVVGLAVPGRAEGLRGDIQPPLGRFSAGPHRSQRADLDLVTCIGRKAPQGKVGLAGAAAARAVQQDVIPSRRLGGQVPIDGDAVRPGQGVEIRHRDSSFPSHSAAPSIPRKKRETQCLPPGAPKAAPVTTCRS